jgi:tripeptidyl-peptidase-2
METGTGLTRAIKAILDSGCSLCNMSYGEDSGIPNSGRWTALLRDELINKHNVVFVSSAGNAGWI